MNKPDKPKPTEEELELQQLQIDLLKEQKQDIEDQRLIQAEQEKYLKEQDLKATREALKELSRRRRLGIAGPNSLISNSLGGYVRGNSSLVPERRP